MRATKANLAYFETQRAQLEAANLNRKGEAEVVAASSAGCAWSSSVRRAKAANSMVRVVARHRPRGDRGRVHD